MTVTEGVVSARRARFAGIDNRPFDAARFTGRSANTQPAVCGGGRESFIDAAIAIVIRAIAICIVAACSAGFAGIDDATVNAGGHSHFSADADATRRRRFKVALVGACVAVVILSVTRRVIARGASGRTAIFDTAIHAARRSRRPANADAAFRRCRHEPFINPSIAVAILPVAGCIVRARGSGFARICDGAIHARGHSRRTARALPARRFDGNVTLVDVSITVIVLAVAVGVIPRWRPWLTRVGFASKFACQRTTRCTNSKTAGRISVDIGLVDTAVTVIILAVAGAIVPGRSAWFARIRRTSTYAAEFARRLADALSADRRCSVKTLVRGAIAIVVNAIARAIVSRRLAGFARIHDLATIAGALPCGLANTRSAGAILHGKILVELSVAVVVDAIACHVVIFAARAAASIIGDAITALALGLFAAGLVRVTLRWSGYFAVLPVAGVDSSAANDSVVWASRRREKDIVAAASYQEILRVFADK